MAFEITRALLGMPELGSKTFDLGQGTEHIVPLYDAPIGESRWMPRFGGASVKSFIKPGEKIQNPRERFDALAPWDQESIFNQYGVSSYDDLVQNIENVRAMPGPTPTRPIIEQDLNALLDVYSQDQRINESNLRSLEQDYAEAPDLEPPQSYFDELREWNRNYQTEQENALWGSDAELVKRLEEEQNVREQLELGPNDPLPHYQVDEWGNVWDLSVADALAESRGYEDYSLDEGGNMIPSFTADPDDPRNYEDVIPIGESPLGEEPIHRSLEALNPLQWTGSPIIPPVEMSRSGRLASMARFPLTGALGLAAALYSPEAGAGSDVLPLEGIFPGGQPELLPEQPSPRGFGYEADVDMQDQLAQWYEQAFIDPTEYGLMETPTEDVLKAGEGLSEWAGVSPGYITHRQEIANLKNVEHDYKSDLSNWNESQRTDSDDSDVDETKYNVMKHLNLAYGGRPELLEDSLKPDISEETPLRRAAHNAILNAPFPNRARDFLADTFIDNSGSIQKALDGMDKQDTRTEEGRIQITKLSGKIMDSLADMANNDTFRTLRDEGVSKEDAYKSKDVVWDQREMRDLAQEIINEERDPETITIENVKEEAKKASDKRTDVREKARQPKKKKEKKVEAAPSIADILREANRQRSIEMNKQIEAQRRKDLGYGWGDMWT